MNVPIPIPSWFRGLKLMPHFTGRVGRFGTTGMVLGAKDSLSVTGIRDGP